jgi:hypothetical protein
MSGLQQTFVGASQITTGAFAIKAANEMREAANQLTGTDQTPFTMPSIDLSAPDSTTAGGNTPNLSGGEEVASGAEGEDEDNITPPDMGGPLNLPRDPEALANAPTPGGFNRGLGGGAGGGGGGGGVSTGGTGPVAAGGGGAGSADAAASMAALKNSDKYISNGGGAGGYRGGGGGGGGGAGTEGGMDLQGMLAALLPKKEDAANDPSMNFGAGAGRAPAADGAVSLLDRSVNIFKRVSDTYMEKSRRGAVGQ